MGVTGREGAAGGAGSLGELESQKLDRHFHFSRTQDPTGRIEQIEIMFLNMLTAIGHVPQGVVLAADEPPTMAQGSFMFTFMGGYHLRRPEHTFEGIPVGSIYLCPKARTLRDNGFTYAMLHELAHFTGELVDADDFLRAGMRLHDGVEQHHRAEAAADAVEERQREDLESAALLSHEAPTEIRVNSTPGVPTRTRSPGRTAARSRTRAPLPQVP